MIELLEKAHITLHAGRNIRVSGNKTSSMVMVRKTGQMRQSIKDSIKMERNMGRDFFCGRMIALMKANFSRIIFMVLVNMSGKMDAFTKDNGKTIKCKAKEYLLGLMDGSMRENIKTIKSKDSEFSHLEMEEYTKVSGKMGSSMEKVSLKRKTFQDKACGKMENVWNGLMKQKKILKCRNPVQKIFKMNNDVMNLYLLHQDIRIINQ